MFRTLMVADLRQSRITRNNTEFSVKFCAIRVLIQIIQLRIHELKPNNN
jgi:hypothetical protein